MVSRHIGGWILVAASLAGAGRDAAGQTMMFPFLGVTNGDLGPIPDGPGPGCGTPGTPRDIRFRPFADAGVSRVDISLTLRHPAAGQLSATLIAPDGTSYEVFPRRGVGGPGDCGDATALDGRYEFRVDVAYVSRPRDAAPRAPGAAAGPSDFERAGFAASFSPGREWTLRLVDWGPGAVGAVAVLGVTVNHPVLPAVSDRYATSAGRPLDVAAPGPVGNDGLDDEATEVVAPEGGPSHGYLRIDGDGHFRYEPYPGFAGTDRFWYFVLTARGVAVEPVTIEVRGAMPPTDVNVAAIAGSRVLVRWQAPESGAAPTGYRLEWGPAPGQRAGAIDLPPTPTAAAIDVPPGHYSFAMRTLSGEGPSPLSDDVLLSTDPGEPPSPPEALAVGVAGHRVTMSWLPTFRGGPPTSARVYLSTTSGAWTFDTMANAIDLAGVPSGTYRAAVGAVGPGGETRQWEAVAFYVPGTCWPPAVPVRFAAFSSPGRLGAVWDPGADGGVPTHYEVAVSGALEALVPVGLGRLHEVPMPAGRYGLRVRAVNPCGVSAFSALQTVEVP
jgi:hypothetical protein